MQTNLVLTKLSSVFENWLVCNSMIVGSDLSMANLPIIIGEQVAI